MEREREIDTERQGMERSEFLMPYTKQYREMECIFMQIDWMQNNECGWKM